MSIVSWACRLIQRTAFLPAVWLVATALVVSGCALGEAKMSPLEHPEKPGPTPPAASSSASLTTPVPRVPITATPLPPPQRPVYVMDPNNGERLSSILVIDPDQQRLVKRISTRYLPSIALSPSGDRLYVADTYWSQVTRGGAREVLSVYNTLDSALVVDDLPVPGRLMYKVYPGGEPFLFLSQDGDRLFLMKYGEPDVHQLRLTVLDAATLEVLHEGPAPPCGRRVQALADRWVCANTPGGTHSPDFQVSLSLDVVDPWTGKKLETLLRVENLHGGAGLALAPSGDRLYLIDRVMNVTVIGLSEGKVLERTRLEGLEGWRLTMEAIALSPDGRHLLLGMAQGQDQYRGLVNQVWVYDTGSWERVSVLATPDPAMHFAFSAAGDQLYSVSPVGQSLTIYDAHAYEETATISGLGGSPAKVVVPDVGR